MDVRSEVKGVRLGHLRCTVWILCLSCFMYGDSIAGFVSLRFSAYSCVKRKTHDRKIGMKWYTSIINGKRLLID